MKVVKSFFDPLTGQAYRRGSEYKCNNEKHIEKLEQAGCITSPPVLVSESVQDLTKKEITELLTEKGIKYKKSDTKEELIQLLQGGE